MGVYLRAKFEVSSIILTGFRLGGILPPPTHTHTSKRTPKKPTQIRVKTILAANLFFVCFILQKTMHFDIFDTGDFKYANSFSKVSNLKNTQIRHFQCKIESLA